MKWKKKTGLMSFEPRDMRIMAQCKMPISEVLQHHGTNKKIPPLWSVLSFVLYKNTSENPSAIWKSYRELINTARNAEKEYHITKIPKSSGGFRQLAVPSPYLRRLQGIIMKTILVGLPIDDHAYAYRKGIRIVDCAAPHVGQQVLIHLDIKDFFTSITEDMVYEMFRKETGYSKSLCRVLAQLCCYKGYLPQGAATSPMLSNIVMYKCDDYVSKIASEMHYVYTRYSDDLFLSGDNIVPPAIMVQKISSVLAASGFCVNRQKTKILYQHCSQSVLGLTTNERIQVNRKYRRRLLQEIHYLERFGRNSCGAQLEGNYLRYLQKLYGRIAYVISVDPENEQMEVALLKVGLRISWIENL